MTVQQQIPASIFGINLRTRTAPLFPLAILAAILSIVPIAPAQTLRILHNFTDTPDGANPSGRLSIDRSGALYGTTEAGGTEYDGGQGIVFRMSAQGETWTIARLYTFTTGSDGIDPSGVLFGPAGVLYGTTTNGGTVYTLRPSATISATLLPAWNITWLYSFPGYDYAYGDVIFDAAGNIYGVTRTGGGSNGCPRGCGLVYKLTRAGGIWLMTILYVFQGGADGANPNGVAFDSAGNLIGTTINGGNNEAGVIFQLTPSGDSWNESVLYSFDCYNGGGCEPAAGLTPDSAGNFYGSTISGSGYSGVIFEFAHSNNGWTYSVLANIPGKYYGGPYAPLTLDAQGNLYGTVANLGLSNPGAVFKLTHIGGGWMFTSLHDFTGPPDGNVPMSTVTIAPNGKLYGTTYHGGNCCGGLGAGTVWELTP